MKVNVVMPKMGESINEGTLIKWHKKKGEEVKKDEIIFEIRILERKYGNNKKI